MSFLNSSSTDKYCGRACIQVKKVFDACLKQITNENMVVDLDNLQGVAPYSFVQAKNIPNSTTLENVTIDSIDCSRNLSRVRADVVIKMEVTYVDSTGAQFTDTTTITVPVDVILCIPDTSIFPYELEAVASVVCPDGNFNKTNNLVLDVCITIILKVLAEVQLVVPTYGYCPISACQDYKQETCTDFFNLPLYPETPYCCKK